MFIDFIKKIFNIQERAQDIDLFTLASQELKTMIERHQDDSLFYVTDYEREKMKTLKEFGLVNSNFVVDTEKEIFTIEEINKLSEVVNYYNKQYPHNPFILYNQARQICFENNFIFCSAPVYTKNIPDGNFGTIKAFKLKDEDKFYYGISLDVVNKHKEIIGIDNVQIINTKGFEIANEKVYQNFISSSEDSKVIQFQYNKKFYYNNFPILICTQPHNLIEKMGNDNRSKFIKRKKYNIQQGHTLILKPVYKNDIYGFLIITVIKDSETNEPNTTKKRKNW